MSVMWKMLYNQIKAEIRSQIIISQVIDIYNVVCEGHFLHRTTGMWNVGCREYKSRNIVCTNIQATSRKLFRTLAARSEPEHERDHKSLLGFAEEDKKNNCASF